jgi:hypothetical protein
MAMTFRTAFDRIGLPLLLLAASPSFAQSFLVQCPNSTPMNPLVEGQPNPHIKCQHVAGSDGFATMADGNQIYLFGFAPLSGLDSLQNLSTDNNALNGLYAGTQTAAEFNKPYAGPIVADGSSVVRPAGGSRDAAIREPAMMMNMGVLAANIPAPLIAVDEDDELFLTLSNVGMIMRPDLFEQHTIHWHGYPNASSYFDGVPDASVAINIAGSFTYYYTAPDAGTYFWHCHITPPEHLQMGMVGQLFVRPRQNQVTALGAATPAMLHDKLVRTYHYIGSTNTYDPCTVDVLCSSPVPPVPVSTASQPQGTKYAYNDGDASTRYDVEYPIQMHGFDPDFHFNGMTFNPEQFADMKDKYFLLNGRSYPDTVNAGVIKTPGSDGLARPAQPLPSVITIDLTHGQTRALLRISDLSVTEYSTLATVGVPMTVIGIHARMLRDLAGNNMSYQTNSITLGGGESMDVIIDVSDAAYQACKVSRLSDGCTFFLYTTNLDHLSNDAENFGGMMTEIKII